MRLLVTPEYSMGWFRRLRITVISFKIGRKDAFLEIFSSTGGDALACYSRLDTYSNEKFKALSICAMSERSRFKGP